MTRLDRKVFFAGWRSSFGALKSEQVVSIEALLAALESDPHVTDARWAAYMLATVYHETATTMAPIHEYGGASYHNGRYGPQTAVGRRLGNTEPGDGAKFAGRGFVQLTGRRNYRVMSKNLLDGYGQIVNLEADPDRALDALTAYRIMSLGMRDGSFTGKSLRHYIVGAKCDYVNARRIINGTDRADLIASYAVKFERILKSAVVADGAPAVAVENIAEGVAPAPTMPVAASPAVAATIVGGGALAVAGTAAVATSGVEISLWVWAVVGVILAGVVAVGVLWWVSRSKA